MEIYTQTAARVSFEAPASTTAVSAKASLNDATPINLILESPVSGSKMRYGTLPFVEAGGVVKILWKFNIKTFTGVKPVTITHIYNVVTPILSTAQIKAVWDTANAIQLVTIEKAVRHIIQAHTGQRFGRFVGSHEVRGSGAYTLELPQRLQELTSVNDDSTANTYFVSEGDGWTLRHYPWGIPPVKADFHGLHQHVGGVIHNPNNVRLARFWRDATYKVDGIWGWDEVPDQVQEAAKLLVNDYACADSQYRDRYLTSMTAADWRIQFYEGAFVKTGNVRADQLLSDFVLRRGWVVL